MNDGTSPVPGGGFRRGFAIAFMVQAAGIGSCWLLFMAVEWVLPFVLIGLFQFVYLLPVAGSLAPRSKAFWKGYWMSAVGVALINGGCFVSLMTHYRS
ncbi:MAG: hypothetical protein R3F17_05180 [Planctomycetota bacterium]